jgi:flagellin-like protein
MSKKPTKLKLPGLSRINDDKRGVSPVLAVAVLCLFVLIAVAAMSGQIMGIVNSIEAPPSADIDGNPGGEELRLTVQGVSNTDDLIVRVDGKDITYGSGGALLNTTSGSTVILDWSGSDEEGEVDVNDNDEVTVISGSSLIYSDEAALDDPVKVTPGSSLITVSAIDHPDNERIVYDYPVPK